VKEINVTLPRRRFLSIGAVSAVSAGFGLASARLALAQGRGQGPAVLRSNIAPEAQAEPTFSFKIETFKPYEGDYFQAQDARDGMIRMKLLRVENFTPTRSGLRLTGRVADSDSFSLVFKADSRLPRFVPIHKVSHPKLGQFDLFLTERKDENGAFFYEAVFNHVP
jgi:hypothetical protein